MERTCFGTTAELLMTYRLTPAFFFLRDEPLHACLAVHLCSIKLPDRPRGLHGQLFREHMGMHICNFHLSNRPKTAQIRLNRAGSYYS